MKIFISWSGRRSHEVADALAGWLKKVIQSAEPWVSSDMERGVKWLAEVGRSLDTHSIGILCVTPGNVSATWLNFEAGALSRQIGDQVRVIPYLLDFRSASELQPPLGQFNASLADESGTYDLIKTLNMHSDPRLSDSDLDETFQMWWPSLRDKIEEIRTSGSGHPPERRTTNDKIDELLDLTRQLMRRLPLSTAESESNAPRLDALSRANTNRLLRSLLETHADSATEPISEETLRIILSASSDRPGRLLSQEEVASRLVAETLRQAGVDVNAMGVMKADDLEVWIYVSRPLEDSLLQKVRSALGWMQPNSPEVKFYTSGETEMTLIHVEEAESPDELRR